MSTFDQTTPSEQRFKPKSVVPRINLVGSVTIN